MRAGNFTLSYDGLDLADAWETMVLEALEGAAT
jgi:hypothetical protein